MKRWLMILGFLLIPGLVGLLVYQQRATPARQLEQGRSLVGSQNGAAFLEQLVGQYPQNAEAHFLRARQHRLEGQVAEAQAELTRAADLGWPRDQVERERLFCAAQVSFAQVEGHLARLLNAVPDDRDALLVLAGGCEQTGRLDRAEALAGRILERFPDDGEALFLRGRVRQRQGHLEYARTDLERALEGRADRLYAPAARLALANCLLNLGRFEPALALYRQCRDAEPANPLALFGLGRTAIHLNQWEEAQQAMEAVLKLRPGHPETLLELARIHEWRGDLERSLELLQQAERQVPDRPELLTQMAKVLRALNQPEQAASYTRRYTEQQERTSRRQQTGGLDERDLPAKSRNVLER